MQSTNAVLKFGWVIAFHNRVCKFWLSFVKRKKLGKLVGGLTIAFIEKLTILLDFVIKYVVR